MKSRSTRRQSEEAEYAKLRRDLLPPGYDIPCEARDLLFCVGIIVCTGWATELHHLRKRSSAGALTNPANVKRLCHACNMIVEEWPEEAHRVGLVLRERDPGWDEMSSREWRKNQ